MEWWHIYLFTRLDTVKNITEVVCVLSSLVVLGIFVAFISFVCAEDTDTAFPIWVKKSWTKILAAYFFVVFLFAAVPTQKEAAAIYLLPKLVNSGFAKEMQQLPEEFASALRVKLEAWVDEMVDDRKED